MTDRDQQTIADLLEFCDQAARLVERGRSGFEFRTRCCNWLQWRWHTESVRRLGG